MRSILLTMAVLGAFAASADDSYLYWMVNTDDGTSAKFEYDAVQVRAYETAAGVDSGNYLTLYYGNGNAAGESVAADVATAGLPFYAALASAMGPSFSYVVELFNDGAKVGQSESLFFTDAMAENYVAFATSTGNLPAMATWMAGGFRAVPEPNSAVLLLLGCGALALRRKKVEVPPSGWWSRDLWG